MSFGFPLSMAPCAPIAQPLQPGTLKVIVVIPDDCAVGTEEVMATFAQNDRRSRTRDHGGPVRPPTDPLAPTVADPLRVLADSTTTTSTSGPTRHSPSAPGTHPPEGLTNPRGQGRAILGSHREGSTHAHGPARRRARESTPSATSETDSGHPSTARTLTPQEAREESRCCQTPLGGFSVGTVADERAGQVWANMTIHARHWR
jgi:hypothetical protein